MKFVLILCLITFATLGSCKPSCFGCPQEADIEKSEAVLKNSLTKLAAGDGPFYELVKIKSATTQSVSGTIDVINADLKDQDNNIKECKIEIWSQPWLGPSGIQVTFECAREDKVIKTHGA